MQEVIVFQFQDVNEVLGVDFWKLIGVGCDDGCDGGEFSLIFYCFDIWELESNMIYWLFEIFEEVGFVGWDVVFFCVVIVG